MNRKRELKLKVPHEKETTLENLFDESYQNEIRLNKRSFYLSRLDKTEVNER